MNPIRAVAIVVGLLALFRPGGSLVASNPQSGPRFLTGEVRREIGEYSFSVLFRTEQDVGLWGYWAGESRVLTRPRIVRFRAWQQDDEFGVPVSSWSDLRHVHSIQVSGSGAKAQMAIHGGDDGGGYVATLRFVNGSLVMRRVESTTFPNEHNETSVYTNVEPAE